MDQHDEFRKLEWEVYKTNQEVRTSVIENLGELSVSGIGHKRIVHLQEFYMEPKRLCNCSLYKWRIDVKAVDSNAELKAQVEV